jgi:hypothetical protein
MYEVWAKDQYGRHEILTVLSTKGKPENQWDTAEGALAAAKRYVHDKNFNTSLTFDQQKMHVSHVVGEVQEGFYAGNLIMGKHKVIQASTQAEVMLPTGEPFRFYLGQTQENQALYLADPRGRSVTDLSSYLVTEKTIVFIKKQ